jgi:glucose-6-phosphate dehydrogenase assembly protein OpcA
MQSTQGLTEVTIHPNVADLYRSKVEQLQSLLTDEGSRPQAMEIIRSMIDRIEVSAGDRRGAPQVLLVGALASILDYAAMSEAQTQNAASGGGGVCRVLMVAGVGFIQAPTIEMAV